MLGVERREVNHYLYSSLKNMVIQDSEYKWSLKTNEIGNNQRIPTQPPILPNQSSQPVKQTNPYEVVTRELTQLSSEEKVKILENAFRQDRYAELEDEQINALQSILEEARREVNIVNRAYTQGKLSFWKTNSLAIAVLSIALTLGTFFIINQLRSNSTYQPTPTIPQNR